MKKMVTITDIANALGFSRNTVSKALNGQYVKPKTKQLIIDTAIKMGYKSFDLISSNKNLGQKRILVLSSVPLLSAYYYIYLLRGISVEAERCGLEVIQYFFKPHSDLQSLKNYISQFDVNGIICIEFFDTQMFREIASLNIPTVFLDYPTYEYELHGNFDILLSESIISVANVCNKLIKKGVTSFSFVGNPENSRSFYERYLGVKEELGRHNLPFNKAMCIMDDDDELYSEISLLANRITSLPSIPQCFICANDFIALKVIDALTHLNLADFNKINVLGFDNGPESKASEPKLSTININKSHLGMNAVHILIERMTTKKSACKIIYSGTTFINRETTNALKD